jgi:uncharacterized membrane protein
MDTADRRIAEVERYIHELAIALSGLPADEREDVIAGIREHIDNSLLAIADPTRADVQRVLDELGDPLAIAADAGAPAPAPSSSRHPDPAVRRPAPPPAAQSSSNAPLLEREWVPIAVIGSFVLAGLFFWLGGPILALATWLLGLVGLLASPLWQSYEKFVGAVAFVAGPVVVFGLFLGYVPDRGLFRDVAGFRTFDRLMGPTFDGSHPLLSLFVAGASVLGLVVVSAWLLARGSARARSASGAGPVAG